MSSGRHTGAYTQEKPDPLGPCAACCLSARTAPSMWSTRDGFCADYKTPVSTGSRHRGFIHPNNAPRSLPSTSSSRWVQLCGFQLCRDWRRALVPRAAAAQPGGLTVRGKGWSRRKSAHIPAEEGPHLPSCPSFQTQM